MKKQLLILLILSLLALWPFFKKGYFESHDGEWMVIRFSAFHQALVSGQLPVRYVERLNNNYGYPVANFLYPLPFYLAEFPKLAGLGFVNSIKIVFIISTIFSSLAMFWALSQIFKRYAALAGALIYLFIPYRFVDLYVRGSLGENLAFAFVPLVAGCIFKIAQGERIYAPILSIATGLLILSHNVIAILFLPFFIIMSAILARNMRLITSSLILGVLTSAFFALPAIYDLKFVRLSQIKVSEIANHLVDFPKLIIPSWGYGPNPNSAGGMSVQIGIVAAIIVISAIVLLIKNKSKNSLVAYFLVVFVLIFLANTKLSLAIWQIIPAADVIQFPWRMHSILIFITAYLAAYLIESSKSKALLASLVIIAAITSTITYIRPALYVNRSDAYYSTNEDTTNVRDEYLPLWAKVKPANRPAEKLELLGEGLITEKSIGHLKYAANVESSANTTLQVNTIYFPNFIAKIDGNPAQVDYDNDFGLINVSLPEGSHEVIINYTRSPVHLYSEITSLIALAATGAYFAKTWRKSNS